MSFVEMLNVPTVGGSQLVPQDLDSAHLDQLNALIVAGARRHVFLSDKGVRLMRASGHFRWLRKPIANQVLPVLHKVGFRSGDLLDSGTAQFRAERHSAPSPPALTKPRDRAARARAVDACLQRPVRDREH